MHEFISIDFETANPKRVSACALGFAKVSNCQLVETKGYLIKPIGGHSPFQSKIHGIKEEHTFDKPDFGELFSEIKDVFNHPLVAHSLFDQQVLCALSDHFNLGICFNYTDSCSVAKERLPDLKDHKLKSLVKHFALPAFKHHDAKEDAIACAKVFLKLQEAQHVVNDSPRVHINSEFKGILLGIMADQEINYKEAYQLLYWLEDHYEVSKQHESLYRELKEVLDDGLLDSYEALSLKAMLDNILKSCMQKSG